MPNIVKAGVSLTQKGARYYDDALTFIKSWWTGKPEMVIKAANRLGIDAAAATPSALIQAAKDSPVTAALLLLEAGEAAGPLLRGLMEESPEIAQVIESLSGRSDKVTSDTSLANISQFSDELDAIALAARLFGGEDRLLALKAALAVDNSVWLLRAQLAQMGYRR